MYHGKLKRSGCSILMSDDETANRPLIWSEDQDDVDNIDEDDYGTLYDEAIEATGYGKFHYTLLAVGGFANASDAIEILCVSILLPAAQCDLNMDSVEKGWLNAMLIIGMMLGGYVWGNLGDTFGRRNVLIVSLFVNAIAGFLSSFAQHFPLFLFLRFASGLGVGGSIPLVWAYTSEFQPANKRGRALSIIAAFWMVGNIIVALLALCIIPFDIGFHSGGFSYNSWRIFLAICSVPSLLTGIFMYWMPESPMYLLTQGNRVEAYQVLQKIFSINNKKNLSDYSVQTLSFSGIKVNQDLNKKGIQEVKRVFIQIYQQTCALFSPSILRSTLLLFVINFSIQFGYYGLWLWFPELFNRLELYKNDHPDENVGVCDLTKYHNDNTTNICALENPVETNALIFTLITSIAPLPANIWTIYHMDKFGRKFFLVLSMILSGVSAFGIYFVKNSVAHLALACIFGAVSTMGFNALDCLGTELFPTYLRSTALAVTLLFARFGAITGNIVFGYLVDALCVVPIMLVAALLLGGGLLGLLLPNTTRTALA